MGSLLGGGVGTLRSSVTVSHFSSEWFAVIEFPDWSAEPGLSGTEASAEITQIVTGPSGSCEASTLQLNVVLLPGPPGALHGAEYALVAQGSVPAATHM